jgi:23S rRNA pseudouridine1911/1915/1917 synthase
VVAVTGFVADERDAGQRLDVALARRLDLPRSQAATRIGAGLVRVDGIVGRKQQRLSGGERIEVADPEPPTPVAAPAMPPVRYRDEHLLVVAKPPGLVVHPGAGTPSGTLVDALIAAGVPLAAAGGAQRPGIVHRLDRDTSGLMVVASTDVAYHGLVTELRRRQVRRRYLALVAGVPAAERGRIEGPIGRDPRDRLRFAVVPDGKAAVTRYRVVTSGAARSEAGSEPVALLSCELETGRTHQIRVHLTGLGHPIVGDPTYGPRPGLALALGLRRPALHAMELTFEHPVTHRTLRVYEPLPAELLAACERAGLATDEFPREPVARLDGG